MLSIGAYFVTDRLNLNLYEEIMVERLGRFIGLEMEGLGG
jgi:hypothetical protein